MSDGTPGPRRRLVVHIGAPKTGTTYLQGLLWPNRAYLGSTGVFMPGRRQRYHYMAGNDLLGDTGTEFTKQARREGGWERFAARIKQSTAPTILVTDERMATLNPEAIAKVAALGSQREIHIVYAARDLSALLPSAWQEAVKHRSTATFQQWLTRTMAARGSEPQPWFWRAHDVPAVLGRWEKAVAAPGHIHLITVPRSASDPDELWRRFASAVGLPDTLPVAAEPRSNASLDRAQAEFLRRVNSTIGDALSPGEYRRWMRDMLAKSVLASRSGPERPVLPSALHSDVAATAAGFIDALATSGYDIIGDLEDLRPEPPAGRAGRPSEADIAAAAVAGMSGMVQTLADRFETGPPRGASGAAKSSWEYFKESVVDAGTNNSLISRVLGWYQSLRRKLSAALDARRND